MTRSAARSSATLAARRTSLDALALPRPVRGVLRAVFAVLARARLYRRARRSTGNVETMTLGDNLHWLYKSEYPLREGLASGAFPRESVLHFDDAAGVERLRIVGTGDAFACSAGTDDMGGLLDALRPELAGADLRFFNLEAPVGASGTPLNLSARETPRLLMARAELDALLDGFGEGTTVASVANNHTLDGGVDGIEATIAALHERSVAAIGVCGRASTYAPTLVSVKGATVGFVAATFGVNGQRAPQGTGTLVRIAPLNEDAGDAAIAELLGDISWCRDRACDVVVASLHRGLEHEFMPRDSQRRLAVLSTTARPRTSPRSSTSTTPASASASPPARRPT